MTTVWAWFLSIYTFLKAQKPSKTTLLIIGASVLITWAIIGWDEHMAAAKRMIPSSLVLGPIKISPVKPVAVPVAGIAVQAPPAAPIVAPVVAAPVTQTAASTAPSLDQRVSALEAEIAELQTHVRKPGKPLK